MLEQLSSIRSELLDIANDYALKEQDDVAVKCYESCNYISKAIDLIREANNASDIKSS